MGGHLVEDFIWCHCCELFLIENGCHQIIFWPSERVEHLANEFLFSIFLTPRELIFTRTWFRWVPSPVAELRALLTHAREAPEHRPPAIAAVEAASAVGPATVDHAADEHHEGLLL